MYGTIARLRVKSGHFDQIVKMTREWEQNRQSEDIGFINSYVFRTDADPDEYMLVVFFTDRESYHANASNPEQDRWYQEMRSHLERDPEWQDGEIVYVARE
jgi:quinol monooxygenase YgiN